MPFPPPSHRPSHPSFGSGPTRKHPGWSLQGLQKALVGRSHRSNEGKEKLSLLLQKVRDVLRIPPSFSLLFIPGSATGAVEAALWNFLGSRPVDIFYWDIFGALWAEDVRTQLKIPNSRFFEAPPGKMPDLTQYNPQHDAVFPWNGTTSGVWVPHGDWIPEDRGGLTLCDATSAAFCVELPWNKLDVTLFSWQKGLGGEAGQGMMVLSERALDQLKQYTPPWPIPRVFRLTQQAAPVPSEDSNQTVSPRELLPGLLDGRPLNTLSLLSVEDLLSALQWAAKEGGLSFLIEKTQKNGQVIHQWLQNHPFLRLWGGGQPLCSPISPCFSLCETLFPEESQRRHLIEGVVALLHAHGVAFDIQNHGLAPLSFRIWTGPTIPAEDLKALTQWMDWALSSLLGAPLSSQRKES